MKSRATAEPVQLLAEPGPLPWADAEIESFSAHHARLMAAGFTDVQADHLAERLVQQDRAALALAQANEEVGLRLCTGCRHWRPGRCHNHIAAGLAVPELAAGWHLLPGRCPGFEAA